MRIKLAPPEVIANPMTIFSKTSGRTNKPARNAVGTEPTINHARSREKCTRHRNIELEADTTLNSKPPKEDCAADNPVRSKIAVNVEPPANPANV